jgi:phospholipid-binding lipoprotein MlaA
VIGPTGPCARRAAAVLAAIAVVACAGPLPAAQPTGADGPGPPGAAADRPVGPADAAASIGAAGAISAGSAAREAAGELDRDVRGARTVDPLEGWNRGVERFNIAIDDALLRPLAIFYDRYTPEVLRLITRNFLSNLLDPYIALNNFLQGKPAAGFSDLGRFTMNTTLGFLGFGDPATDVGFEKHREDFGQTLGVWGVPTGPYLVLPVFGPSNVRDGFGFGVDAYAALINRFENVPFRNSVAGLELIETRARLLPTQRMLDEALDRYLLVRDSYLQRRRNLVHDGNPPDLDED